MRVVSKYCWRNCHRHQIQITSPDTKFTKNKQRTNISPDLSALSLSTAHFLLAVFTGPQPSHHDSSMVALPLRPRTRRSDVCHNKTPTQSPFLNLPGELRNIIYSHVFSSIAENFTISIVRRKESLRKKSSRALNLNRRRTSPLSLLMTCKQIHTEAYSYVHGTVPASLVLGKSFKDDMKQIFFGSDAGNIARGIHMLGNALKCVTHIHLGGMEARMLLPPPNEAELRILRAGGERMKRRKQPVAKLARQNHVKVREAFHRTALHLPNLRIATITDALFNEMPRLRSDWGLAILLLTDGRRLRVAWRFPYLKEIRVVGTHVGKRFRREEVEVVMWREWYGGTVVPYLEEETHQWVDSR